MNIVKLLLFIHLGISCVLLNSCKDQENPILPELTTALVQNITQSSANSGGEITNDNGLSVIQRGVCWSINPNPEPVEYFTSDGSGGGAFTSTITGLQSNTSYYIRAYAINKDGIGYGMALNFTTYPSLSTVQVKEITYQSAVSGGNIPEGGSPITERGICWGTSPLPTIKNYKLISGSGSGSYECTMTELTPMTKYYVRAFASNSSGLSYGNQEYFTTNATSPTIQTAKVTEVTTTSAVTGGSISNNGGDLIIEKGVCWGTSKNPTLLHNYIKATTTGSGSYSIELKDLLPNTTYYVRAYATNNFGTSYGNNYFIRTATGILSDISGNWYYTVTIGSQIWMAENLKTLRYNDGTTIPLVSSSTTWQGLTTGAVCYYDNRSDLAAIFGSLYNWYSVNTGKLCPTDWHVASITEWEALSKYLIDNGYNYDESNSGNKIAKSLAAATWWHAYSSSYTSPGLPGNSDYPEVLNKSGFSALPAGVRTNGNYQNLGERTDWWSSSIAENGFVYLSTLTFMMGELHLGQDDVKHNGYSVRCIKD